MHRLDTTSDTGPMNSLPSKYAEHHDGVQVKRRTCPACCTGGSRFGPETVLRPCNMIDPVYLNMSGVKLCFTDQTNAIHQKNHVSTGKIYKKKFDDNNMFLFLALLNLLSVYGFIGSLASRAYAGMLSATSPLRTAASSYYSSSSSSSSRAAAARGAYDDPLIRDSVLARSPYAAPAASPYLPPSLRY